MSNDDLGKLPPLGGEPLDGDLENLPPAGGKPLGGDLEQLPPLGADLGNLPPLGGDALEEIAQPISIPPTAEDVAQLAPPPEGEAAPVGAGEGIAEAEEPVEKGPGFLARLAQANPYTVILAASLLALLIGILCLLLEWGSYNFDTKAKEAGPSARVSAPLEAGIAPTRA